MSQHSDQYLLGYQQHTHQLASDRRMSSRPCFRNLKHQNSKPSESFRQLRNSNNAPLKPTKTAQRWFSPSGSQGTWNCSIAVLSSHAGLMKQTHAKERQKTLRTQQTPMVDAKYNVVYCCYTSIQTYSYSSRRRRLSNCLSTSTIDWCTFLTAPKKHKYIYIYMSLCICCLCCFAWLHILG